MQIPKDNHLWLFNGFKEHTVFNAGTTERIHIVASGASNIRTKDGKRHDRDYIDTLEKV